MTKCYNLAKATVFLQCTTLYNGYLIWLLRESSTILQDQAVFRCDQNHNQYVPSAATSWSNLIQGSVLMLPLVPRLLKHWRPPRRRNALGLPAPFTQFFRGYTKINPWLCVTRFKLFLVQSSIECCSQSFGTSTESTTLTFISLCHNMSQPSLYRDATFKPFASFAQPIHWCSQAHVTSPPSLTNIVAVQPGRVLKAKFYGPRRPMAAQAAHIATFRKDVKTCEDMGRHVKTTNISRILEEKTRFVFWTSFIPQE